MPASASELLLHVQATLAMYRMLLDEARVLVACSGGGDSVALLHTLHELGYALEVAHIDHQSRDGESAEDAAFVRELARSFDLPYHETSVDVAKEASERGESFEEYARNARYAFLSETASAQRIDYIATGHHADDQAETVLMRILRGTSPEGLAGIPPLRQEDDITIVRPLIRATRSDILAYLDERAIAYRTDSSNEDTRHFRNRIRHQLLPMLEAEYSPGLRERLVRLAEMQRAENELAEQVTRLYSAEFMTSEQDAIVIEAFRRSFTAVQRRVIRHWAGSLGIDCPFERVEAARDFILHASAGKLFDFGGGFTLRKTRDRVDLYAEGAPRDDSEIALAIPGETIVFGKRYRVRFLDECPSRDLTSYCTPHRQVFDAAALGLPLLVRHRRDGDRMQPLGMNGSKKLQDIFVDAGIPSDERDAYHIVLGGEVIAWVVGLAVSAHAAVTPLTETFIEIEATDDVQ